MQLSHLLGQLQVNFEPDSRQQYLNLLGYSQSSVKSKVTDAMKKMNIAATAADSRQTSVS